ncbi:hypothetical protein HMPREF9996_02143 [Aggregatibacter actinomycetemcomitans Y4]|nr:hypothetical protein HMPREF9996_02143 [Aggregatibacter actinomycetemcomitans Y4]
MRREKSILGSKYFLWGGLRGEKCGLKSRCFYASIRRLNKFNNFSRLNNFLLLTMEDGRVNYSKK